MFGFGKPARRGGKGVAGIAPAQDGHDFAADLDALERRLRALENAEHERSLEWLGYVSKLERLVRRVMRVDGGDVVKSGAEAGNGRTSAATLTPPPGLRGARLRIWYREHGGIAPTPESRGVFETQPGASVEASEDS